MAITTATTGPGTVLYQFAHITGSGSVTNTNGGALDVVGSGNTTYASHVVVDGYVSASFPLTSEATEHDAAIQFHAETTAGDGSTVGGADGSTLSIGKDAEVYGYSLSPTLNMYGLWLASAMDVSNDGTVVSNSVGALVDGTGTVVRNGGRIEGQNVGVLFADGHHTSQLVNTGAVYGGNTAIRSEMTHTLIDNQGTIVGASAIEFDHGSATVRNSGHIGSERINGAALTFGDGLISVTNTGTMSGVVQGSQANTGWIMNTGTITGYSKGVDFQKDTGVGVVELTNEGEISGSAYSVLLGGGTSWVNNAGRLVGAVELDEQTDAGADTLINSGDILGEVQTHGGIDSVTNSGLIEGNVSLGIGSDVLINSGRIAGDVVAGDSSEAATHADRIANSGRIEGKITLGLGNDTFDGRGGDVLSGIYGGEGNDLFVVDNATDEIFELFGEGDDTVEAYANHRLGDYIETLRLGGTADLRGTGNGLSNDIDGNMGDNRLKGGGGQDTISGDEGNDTLVGGADNDTLDGGAGYDVLRGGAGADNLAGGDDDDRLISGAGNDLLNGDAGDDLLRGGKGKDTLNGGVDDDVLIGGRGADILIGGYGDDVFKFTKASDNNAGSGYDRINDFARGQDQIDLSALGVALSIGGSLTGGSRQAITTEVASTHTRIFIDMDQDGSADMRIDVRNTLGLTEDDFIL